MNLGYEYFCGANVVLSIEGAAILEAAGLSANIMESKAPVYGYSSRHFDAIASGQVLVQGSLLINYVHHDYLFKTIEQGLSSQGFGTFTTAGSSPSGEEIESDLFNVLEDPVQRAEAVNAMLANPLDFPAISAALKEKFLTNSTASQSFLLSGSQSQTFNPHDSFGGMDIQVMFGKRSAGNSYIGDTGFLIEDVYFTGRGMPIRIDEEVIVEEYSFIARNISSLRVNYIPVVENLKSDTQDPSITVQRAQ